MEIFISKSADGSKWIKCTDKDCFLKQGGKADEGGRKFQTTKFKITEAENIYNKAEALMTAFINKHDRQNALPITEKAVMLESLFRTLSGNFKP